MKKMEKWTSLLYAFLAILILAGAFLKLRNVDYSGWISLAGFAGGITLLVAENAYLRKRIRALEKKDADYVLPL